MEITMDSKIVCPKCGTDLTLHDMYVLGHIEVGPEPPNPKIPRNEIFRTDGYEYQCHHCGGHIPCGSYGNILEDERKEGRSTSGERTWQADS